MIENPWSSLSGTSDRIVGRRIAQEHPLDYYWARAQGGALGLVLRGVAPAWMPRDLPSLRGVDISTASDDDIPEVRMFLRRPGDQDVFLTLCRDVIAYSCIGGSQDDAARRFFRRLEHWHLLMSRARTDAMDAHEVRGLIGELVMLERLMLSVGVEAAISSWVAPDDHPQDFALERMILEIKTRSSGSRPHVQISSLEQLQASHLALFLVTIELAEAHGESARSLNEVCADVLGVARAHSLTMEDRLEVALLKRGYVRNDVYNAIKYRVSGISSYSVGEGFPRILRSEIDSRVVRASYVLDLSSLTSFVVPIETILH
ncbi:PD-(D/E)XK motif protein [Stenotrophomonas indicatrix]|uniref:PD-(D/E)XK motif protein n=1 Tax=Stenotrophomonas indicatrix TaxID=2045451 RepID=UPI0013DB334D